MYMDVLWHIFGLQVQSFQHPSPPIIEVSGRQKPHFKHRLANVMSKVPFLDYIVYQLWDLPVGGLCFYLSLSIVHLLSWCVFNLSMISLNTYLYLKLFDIIHLLQNACAYLFLHIIVGAVFAGINLNSHSYCPIGTNSIYTQYPWQAKKRWMIHHLEIVGAWKISLSYEFRSDGLCTVSSIILESYL